MVSYKINNMDIIWLLHCNGVMMMNVALDNISKYFKDGLVKDPFNFRE